MVLGSVLGRKRWGAGSWLTSWTLVSWCAWEVVLVEGNSEVRYQGGRSVSLVWLVREARTLALLK
jgi:hypothetical protein